MTKISKFIHERYMDTTPYESLKNIKNPKRQIQGAQSRAAGNHFEGIIDDSCRYYEDHKIAVIEKTPEPMKIIKSLGKGRFVTHFEKQAQPDYKGTLKNGRAVVFEAKHSKSRKIDQGRLSREQIDKLQKHHELGAIAFVLVSINMQDFYRIPWSTWRDMKEIYGHKHMTVEELKTFKIKIINGIIRLLD